MTPGNAEAFLTGWLAENQFKVLDTRSDGSEKSFGRWDGTLLIHPKPGALVAMLSLSGGGAIIFEVTLTAVGESTAMHIEGYVTGRGPGWKGKEFEFISEGFAVAMVPRKRGFALVANLENAMTRLSGTGATAGSSVPQMIGWDSGSYARSPAFPIAGHSVAPTISPARPPVLASQSQGALPGSALFNTAPPSVPYPSGLTRERAQARSRLLFVVSMVGLALVMVAILGKNYVPWELAIPGFVLIIAGGVGLISLSLREQSRPVQPSLKAGADRPYSVFEDANLAATPPVFNIDPSQTRRFDLGPQAEAYRKRMRFSLTFRVVAYGFFAAMGVLFLVLGALRADWTDVGLGCFLIALGLALMIIIREVGRPVVALSVGPQEITFDLGGNKTVTLPWRDPKFGLRLTETPDFVNRTINDGNDHPSYQLFTGTGSGLGHSARVLADIPQDCFYSILQYARAQGLVVTPEIRGRTGTVSERHTYTILPQGMDRAP